ncbi:unnamed protein product, partial [Meganyctiphanes norvegica]
MVSQARGIQDALGAPSWLHGVHDDGDASIAKSRKRRFIDFPTGSTISVVFTMTVPTEGFSDSGSLTMTNTLTFNLPNTTDIEFFGFGRSDSGYHNGAERNDLYSHMEEFLTGMGYDGHACTLRTICEVAEMPFEHGLVGEAINVMLSVAAGPGNR